MNLWCRLAEIFHSSTGNSFIQCWSASGFPPFPSPLHFRGIKSGGFLGRSRTLHFSSFWHYLVDLLESSSFYKVHFWFWPHFMLKNSVIVESRTATCPLCETTKFSERFSVYMLFSQEDTIGQHKTCVLFCFWFFAPTTVSLVSVSTAH